MDRYMNITSLIIALSLPFIGFSAFAEPIQLRCHMDSCSWANIQTINKLEHGKDGGELNEMMMGSVIAKMREGGNAKRVASKADGTEQLQSYKIGGWTHS